MSQKTNKSFTKRLKITKNGKLKARKPGFNHFNAKQSSTERMAGRKDKDVTASFSKKVLHRNLPHHNV
ncbi:MAG: 50S ribosomal protein L35 [Candidatus Pacebacteria bacterium]|jgi:ribosomal protein L35|nr:50S ribosomal protein L35 [Candidatus Paceibacterota bacterium]